jgi:hypothetical protein
MKLRWKFLSFLAVFLLGSFLIVTWKSYSIFSQKYVKSLQQMELQSLEKQGQYISQQFSDLQKILTNANEVEGQLKARGIGLLAHVVNEDGKWKAQWFEGIPGYRKEATNMTKQISFEALPSARKSWHLVQLQEKNRGYAFVIPAVDGPKVSYFVFFLTKDYMQKLFKGQSFLETMVAYSPQIGQVYSMGDFDDGVIEQNRALLTAKQSGFIPTSRQGGVYFYFHPDLQLYLLKTQSMAALQVESPTYLLTLFGIIVMLIALSMVAFDLLLKNIFGRLEYVTASLRMRVETPSSTKHFTDELQEIEYLTHYLEDGGIILKSDKPSAPPPAPGAESNEAAQKHEEFLNEIRPKAINSLGYFHRIKAQVPATPNLQLLEKELREMRALIDPATATAQGAKPTPSQPYFNPILDTFKKETSLEPAADAKAAEKNSPAAEAFIAEITKVESAPMVLSSLSQELREKIKTPTIIEDAASDIPTAKEIAEEVAEAMKAISALNIRKPKREGHESNNI